MRAVFRSCHLIPIAGIAAMLLSVGSAAAAPPRTVLYNGTVFTGDPAWPCAHAMAIKRDQVVTVGRHAELPASRPQGTVRIGLGGRLVVPGLNDAHVHVEVPEGN